MQLPSSIWWALRKHKVAIRTPEEQRNYLLEEAAVAVVKDEPYPSSLQRVLRAALALDAKTRELDLVFKGGAKAELDLFLNGSNLLVHERWLDFHASHDKAPCWLSHRASIMKIPIDELACDHVVIDLYDLLLMELNKKGNKETSGGSRFDTALRLTVHESFRAMPRMIRINQGEKSGMLKVSWQDEESNKAFRYGLNVMYQVTLHRESTCSHRKLELLKSNGKQCPPIPVAVYELEQKRMNFWTKLASRPV